MKLGGLTLPISNLLSRTKRIKFQLFYNTWRLSEENGKEDNS